VTFLERRSNPRYGFQGEVEIAWGSSQLRAMVSDISKGGMFVVAANPLWVGATFSARVLLDTPLEVDCVVRRVLPGRGMGIQFIKVASEAQGRLDKVVEMLANP